MSTNNRMAPPSKADHNCRGRGSSAAASPAATHTKRRQHHSVAGFLQSRGGDDKQQSRQVEGEQRERIYTGPPCFLRAQQVGHQLPGAYAMEGNGDDDMETQSPEPSLLSSSLTEVSAVAYPVNEEAELRRRIHDLEEECLQGRQHVQRLEQQVLGLHGSSPPGAESSEVNALGEEMIRQVRLNAAGRREFMAELLSLGARGEYEQGIERSQSILREMGINLPSEPTRLRNVLEVLRTKRAVLKKSPAQIVDMPIATDPEVVNAIQVLNLFVQYAFHTSKFTVIPVAAASAIKLVLKHGVSHAGAFCFAAMGGCLAGCGFFKDAYHFGDVALGILERLGSHQWLAPAYMNLWVRIFVYKVPLQECISRLIFARGEAEESGLCLNTSTADCYSILMRFSAGQPLEQLLPEIRQAREFATTHQVENVRLLIEAKLQEVLNLRGHSDDILILSGEAINEEVALGDNQEAKNDGFLPLSMLLWKCEIACIMGEYERAVEFASCFYRLKSTELEDLWAYTMHFYRALASLAVAQGRRSERNRFRRVALRCLRRLRKVDQCSPQNFRHMTMLIRAEDACLRGDKARSLEYYDESILSSEQGEFLHHQALACERKAIALDRFGEAAASRATLATARSLYEEWGATCKVKQIDDMNV